MPTDWLGADPLDPAVIGALLTTSRLGRALEVHRSLTSTGDRVRELAPAGPWAAEAKEARSTRGSACGYA